MSLEDKLNDTDPQITELRNALLNAQRQLAKVKKNRDDFTAAVVQAAHDAMLSAGPLPAVPTPVKDTHKEN